MNDRELMQESLYAFEEIAWSNNSQWQSDRAKVAIIALRKKLAHPVQFKCTIIDDEHPDGVPLSKWGRHSEQEPFCYHDGRNIVGKEYAHHSDVFPLYAAPPPRQPLTDEEIEDLYFDGFSISKLKQFARAIEDAHGIGSNDAA